MSLASPSPDELMRQAFPRHEAGDIAGAERLYLQILETSPDYADAHYLLGRIELDRGQPEAALRRIREAIRCNRAEPAYHKTLAEIHFGLGHWQEAVAYLGNAVELDPRDHEAWNNLGVVCDKLGQPAEAARHYERALQLRQNSPMALNNAAIALKDRGRVDEAIELFGRVRGMLPDDAEVASNYLYALNFTAKVDAERRFLEHLAFDRQFGTGRLGPPAPRGERPDPGRRLKVGYFSPDLRSHPVSCFVEAPLRLHDRQAFEVWCYYLHPYGDATTESLKRCADHWVETRGLDDETLAARIVADGIDILVDLAGHTGGNRLAVLGRKPAPVIATWLGYPGSTGLRTVDYKITDAGADPVGMTERYHTEALVRLERQWCFAVPEVPAEVTPLPALRNGHLRFASFNNSAKVTDDMVGVWAAILREVPGSRLLVWGVEDEQAERIRRIFRDGGVDGARLEFSPRTSFPKQVVMYQGVDIALDTFPYSGVTTTFNSLWMGVPVVTRAGDSSAARSTHSILAGLGLRDWSADSAEGYVETAVRQARDVVGLAALRARLRARLQASPYMDAAGFTRGLEQAYREMWRAHCRAGAR